jgi:hypothetical protein
LGGSRGKYLGAFSQHSSHRRVFVLAFDVDHRRTSTKLEMNAVKKLQTLGMGAVVAAAAFGLFTLTASAQQPPAAAPATPGVVAKPVMPAAPAIAKAPAAAKATTTQAPAATPATTEAKKPKSTASVCKGLDMTACKANTACDFIEPKDANDKTGKVQKPYCRKVAGVAAKKPATATPTAAKPAAATTAPAAKPTAPAAAAAVKPVAPAGAPAAAKP